MGYILCVVVAFPVLSRLATTAKLVVTDLYLPVPCAEAARVWELAAPIYQANERFSSVSRIYSDMGDMYAADEDWGNACDALKLAADFSTAADEPT